MKDQEPSGNVRIYLDLTPQQYKDLEKVVKVTHGTIQDLIRYYIDTGTDIHLNSSSYGIEN